MTASAAPFLFAAIATASPASAADTWAFDDDPGDVDTDRVQTDDVEANDSTKKSNPEDEENVSGPVNQDQAYSSPSYDAFGDGYHTALEANAADVVDSANASIANIAQDGGQPTDYTVSAEPGVYRHDSTTVVVGSDNGQEDIFIKPDLKGQIEHAHIGAAIFPLGDTPSDHHLIIAGNGGNGDLIVGSSNPDRFNNTILGGSGTDIVFALADPTVIYGGDGHDRLIGGEGDDTISGGNGNDLIEANGGNDFVLGGPGDDVLYGGADDDMLFGQEGDDYVEGGSGHDILIDGNGQDILSGGRGKDILDGGPGDDTIVGGPGADSIFDTANDADTIYTHPLDQLEEHDGDELMEVVPDSDLGSSIRIVADRDGRPPTQRFTERVSADLVMLQSIPEGQKLLAAIDQPGRPVTIGQEENIRLGSRAFKIPLTPNQPTTDADRLPNGKPGKGVGAHIQFANFLPLPNEVALDYPLHPSIALSHELIHARDFVNGTNETGRSYELDPDGNLQQHPHTGGYIVADNTELKVVGLPYGHGFAIPDDDTGQPQQSSADVTENSIRSDLNLRPSSGYVVLPPSTFESIYDGSNGVRAFGSISSTRRLDGNGANQLSRKGQDDHRSGDSHDAEFAEPYKQPTCVDSGLVNDGWGWTGSESCRLPIAMNSGECTDSDGDGWGWTGTASCQMETPTSTD